MSCALECFDIQLDTAVFEATSVRAASWRRSRTPCAMSQPVDTRTVARFRDALEDSSAILGDRLRVSHSVNRADLGERWVEVTGSASMERRSFSAPGRRTTTPGRGGRRVRW